MTLHKLGVLAAICILSPFALILFTFDNSEAQDLSRIEQLRDQMPNHFTFVRSGEPSIRVVVVGTVLRPGTYEVRKGTDLNTLFLYTGGPSQIGTRTRRRSPDVNMFLSREQAGGRRVIFNTTFRDYIDEDVEFPELQNLDMIIVETDPVPPALWREVLAIGAQILGVITSIIVLLWRYDRLGRDRN